MQCAAWVARHTIRLFNLKLMCCAAQCREEKNPTNLLCLEVMPFCGFNTWPSHCALVSPVISSNLATLNWILCKGPSVLWERHTLFREQRAFSGAVVFWIAPGLTSQTGTTGVTFHFLLATGKRSIPRGGWHPSLSSAAPPQLIHLSKCGWLQLQSDLTVGVMCTDTEQ